MEIFSSSLNIAIKANEFLDSLSLGRSTKNTLEILEDFKQKMLELGFHAPFKSVLLETQKEFLSNPVLEAADQRKQKSYIYYFTSFKKFTLNRVAVAYSAHKLKTAFESFGYDYLIEFLPLGGEYREKLQDIYAVQAYFNLQNIFQSKKIIINSASKVIDFDKKYKIFSRKPSLIKNYSLKVALFCAISLFASKKAREEVGKNTSEQVKKYNSILKSFGYAEDVVPNDFSKYPNLTQSLEKEGLIVKNKNNLFLLEELEASLNRRRLDKKNKTILYSSQILLDLLFNYYLTTNLSTRLNSPFSFSAQPSKEQLEILNSLVGSDWFVLDPAEFLNEKFLFEQNKLPISQKILGPAFLCVKRNLSLEFISQKYTIEIEELKNVVELVKNIENKDSKLSLFIEGLEKNNKKESVEDVNLKGKEKSDL